MIFYTNLVSFDKIPKIFSIFGQKTKIFVNIQNPKLAEIVGERAPFTKIHIFTKLKC